MRPALIISTAHLLSLISLFLFSLQISPPASSRSIPFGGQAQRPRRGRLGGQEAASASPAGPAGALGGQEAGKHVPGGAAERSGYGAAERAWHERAAAAGRLAGGAVERIGCGGAPGARDGGGARRSAAMASPPIRRRREPRPAPPSRGRPSSSRDGHGARAGRRRGGHGARAGRRAWCRRRMLLFYFFSFVILMLNLYVM